MYLETGSIRRLEVKWGQTGGEGWLNPIGSILIRSGRDTQNSVSFCVYTEKRSCEDGDRSLAGSVLSMELLKSRI